MLMLPGSHTLKKMFSLLMLLLSQDNSSGMLFMFPQNILASLKF
jgi:hypothetical protein